MTITRLNPLTMLVACLLIGALIGCDEMPGSAGKTGGSDMSLSASKGLSFHIVVEVTEVGPMVSQRTGLDDGSAATPEGMAWLPIDQPLRFAGDAGDREQIRTRPINFFIDRNMVVKRQGEGLAMLVWNTAERSMTHDADQAWGLTRVKVELDNRNLPAVSVTLNEAGAERMKQITADHIGRGMAIVIDGRVYLAPIIRSTLGQSIQLTGGVDGFTRDEAVSIVKALGG